MDQNGLLILYAALFVGILLAFEGFVRLVRRDEGEERANLRMRLRNNGTDPEEILAQLRRVDEREAWQRFPLINRFPELVMQSGVRISTLRLFFYLVAWTLVLMVIFDYILGSLLGIIFSLSFGIVVPVLFLLAKRNQRLNRMSAQMPDMLDLIVRSLRSGHPINTAMAVVAREMPDPIGTECGVVVDQVTFGDSLPDAIQEMSERVGIEDVSYFAVAVRIQSGTGGNLAEILSALAKVVRDRFAMKRKISAVSAEGRISAYILSCMPFAVAGLLTIFAPEYLGAVSGDPLFIPLVIVVILLASLNAAVLYKLTHFRI